MPTTTTNPQEGPTEVYKTQQEPSQTPQSSSWHPLELTGPPQDLIGSPNTWEMLILEPLAPDTTMDLKLLYSERDFWAEEPVLSRASLRMRFTWFSKVCRSVLPGVGSSSLLWAFSMTCHPTRVSLGHPKTLRTPQHVSRGARSDENHLWRVPKFPRGTGVC